jgi:hypothetical protein
MQCGQKNVDRTSPTSSVSRLILLNHSDHDRDLYLETAFLFFLSKTAFSGFYKTQIFQNFETNTENCMIGSVSQQYYYFKTYMI